MDSSSDLFDLKNYFVLGNYQGAINEGQSLGDLEDPDRTERDVFVYRSYVAQGNYQLVLDEVKQDAPRSLQAVRLLAVYYQAVSKGSVDAVQDVVKTARQWLSDPVQGSNPFVQLLCGALLFQEDLMDDAFRAVYHGTTLEATALLVQIYLKTNRVDLAEKELKKMSKVDDDATLTQLAHGWVALVEGGEKVSEALANFESLGDKYGLTAPLLNGIAVCRMHLGRHVEAEKALLQALEKKSNDPDTLANLITCYHHQGKTTDIINRQYNQLKSSAPKHPWLLSQQKAESDFEKFSAQFTVGK